MKSTMHFKAKILKVTTFFQIYVLFLLEVKTKIWIKNFVLKCPTDFICNLEITFLRYDSPDRQLSWLVRGPGEIKSRDVELDSLERAQERSRAGTWSWTLKREPRRDQEQGRGAGLSRESPGEIKSRDGELDSQERAQARARAGTWSWAFITGWFVLLQSCSSTAASRTLSLWLYSAQLLKQQLVEYTSCFALAGSPPP